MGMNVKENTLEEIQKKLETIETDLNKIDYLESALKNTSSSFEIKKFIWGELAKLYSERKMFEKAAKAMSNKAGIEASFREKIEDYLYAAELFVKAGKIEDAEEIFIRATRNSNSEDKAKIKLARKNIYLVSARELESGGKRAGAAKFYEKIIKMNLDEIEKSEIKNKLLKSYKALGMFREAR